MIDCMIAAKGLAAAYTEPVTWEHGAAATLVR